MELIDVYEDVRDYMLDTEDSIADLRRNFERLENAMQEALIVNGNVVDLSKINNFKNDAQNEINKIRGSIIPTIDADIEELEEEEDDDD